jgi:hypothetical protein
MNPYLNEELTWQRLKDVQREAENSRIWSTGSRLGVRRLVRLMGQRLWLLATRRAARGVEPIHIVEDSDGASDAA